MEFLQSYSPSHEHVAPHESWLMKQLGNYPGQENAEWSFDWWKVFLEFVFWYDSP